MHKLAWPALVGAVAVALPALANAADTPPYAARVTLPPGAAFRIPADRTAIVSERLNPCFLRVAGGGREVVLEGKDDARGLALLAGETVANVGGTAVAGGHIPRVTCLLSLLIYPAGPNPAVTGASVK